MAKSPKVQKPRLAKDGKPVETVDAKISKISDEDLANKLKEAQRMVEVYMEEQDRRKTAAFEEFRAKAREMGFELVRPGAQPKSKGTRKARTEKAPEDRECKICNVKGHDQRRHRSQNPKRPFTQEELAAL